MADREPARTVARRTRTTVFAAVVVVLVVALVFVGAALVVSFLRQPLILPFPSSS
jgi:hypothetical protein